MFFTRTCINNCCVIHQRPACNATSPDYRWKYGRQKAGVILYTPDTILLVQSHGKKWGPPKGTVEQETVVECAARELAEETGILLEDFENDEQLNINKAVYFLHPSRVEYNISNIESDVTGITWIKLDCLKQMHKLGVLELSHQCKRILDRLWSYKN